MSRRAHCRSASLFLVASLVATTVHAANYVRRYLVSDVLLPTTSSEANSYAIDVDGDGIPENQFGQILSVLSSQGFDFNGAMHAAVTSGGIVHLVELQSTDASFKNDPAAQASWCIGEPMVSPPLFDGTDNPACADTSGLFVAALSGGSFTSPAPASTPNPVSLSFELSLGTSKATLGVLDARLSFATDGAGNISFGQINGSIPHEDLINQFLPTLAANCNAAIESDPSSDTSVGCTGLFDSGCSGHPEFAGDGLIELCEVTENSLIQGLFAPDVQVPEGGSSIPANSVGFRFTAIAYDRVFAGDFEL